MKKFNKDWWEDTGIYVLLCGLIIAGGVSFTTGHIAGILKLNKIVADINNEDIIAEETNVPEKIYNIELADGTIVSFTEEEYENFKEYLNSIKAEEEKTYKLTR